MATRLQSAAFGFGLTKQADILTASTTYMRLRQLSTDVPTLIYGTETDKDEIGKGNEFVSQVFPTAYGFTHSVNKYSSAEFTGWAWGYALGTVGLSTGLYTIVPIDPGTTLQLPFFTFVQQLAEGGGTAIDEAILGCQIEEVTTTFKYGAGRASSETNISIIGSGRHTIPSAITLPTTPLIENNLLSQSMTITVNGIDYVAGTAGVGAGCILMGSIGWKNNLLVDLGHHPGSGLVDAASVMDRLFIGNRVPTFQFTAFLEHNSTEYAKLIAQTTGTAACKLQHDATHYVQWSFPKASFSRVERTQEEGIVAVTVTVEPQYDSVTSTVLSVTSKNALTDIAQ